MNNKKKPTTKEVAQFLKEALQPFCDPLKGLRPALAEPFRQYGLVMASDGHILISISPKSAGVAIGPFRKMDDFDATKAIPAIGSSELMNARTVRRIAMKLTIDKMKLHEEEHRQVTMADVYGVKLSIEGLSQIEAAMRICGAEQARLVWHDDCKVVLQLENAPMKETVTILHMGMLGLEGTEHIIALPTSEVTDDADFSIDWQKGMEAWADIKADMERKEEEERMARREVYLVQMVKVAYIPVYAKNADEARQLADSEAWFEPEDDGDDEWVLGDEMPESENLDDLDNCYEHVITRDGVVERDEIYELEQIREEWQQKQNKEDGQ